MISATITPKSAANFKRLVDEYQRKVGKTEHELMVDLAKSQAKALASVIQPFGVSAKIGKRFEGSIIKQIFRAVKNANITGGNQTAAQAHESRRNQRGIVPTSATTRGQYKRSPISFEETLAYAKKKARNAGFAKAAWIAAAESIDGKKLSGIPKWLREDVKHGSSKVSKEKSSTVIFLKNHISYITSVMNQSDANKALSVAYNKNLKRMQSALNKVK
tara:strand:- start:305 stop:958 length:654 start_codon:yes stop_codon:yes gene_type:complete